MVCATLLIQTDRHIDHERQCDHGRIDILTEKYSEYTRRQKDEDERAFQLSDNARHERFARKREKNICSVLFQMRSRLLSG